MENSSLNAAHFYARKADNHLKYLRFDESIECHQKAADNFLETIKNTVNQKAIESIRLQYSFHIKQKEMVKLKKIQYEKYKKAVEHQQLKMIDSFQNLSLNERIENSNSLQISIFKTMDDTDLLLEELNKFVVVEHDSPKSNSSSDDTKSKTKQSATIDELKNLNHKLHILVYKLVSQMDETVQENTSLKLKLHKFEKPDEPKSSGGSPSEKIYKINMNINEEKMTSLNQYSLSSDISPEDGIEAQELELAPLDLPTFDLSSLSGTNSSK